MKSTHEILADVAQDSFDSGTPILSYNEAIKAMEEYAAQFKPESSEAGTALPEPEFIIPDGYTLIPTHQYKKLERDYSHYYDQAGSLLDILNHMFQKKPTALPDDLEYLGIKSPSDQWQAGYEAGKLQHKPEAMPEDLEAWIREQVNIHYSIQGYFNTDLETSTFNIIAGEKEAWGKGATAVAEKLQPVILERGKIIEKLQAALVNEQRQGYLLLGGIEAKDKEIERLRDWKQSAISVTPDMQAIGKEMGVPLGQSIHDKILPFIQQQKAEIERLKNLIEQQFKNQFFTLQPTQLHLQGKYWETWQQFKKENNL